MPAGLNEILCNSPGFFARGFLCVCWGAAEPVSLVICRRGLALLLVYIFNNGLFPNYLRELALRSCVYTQRLPVFSIMCRRARQRKIKNAPAKRSVFIQTESLEEPAQAGRKENFRFGSISAVGGKTQLAA